MNSPKIGQAICIVASNMIGILTQEPSTFLCRGTSKIAPKMQALRPLKTATLSLFPVPQTIWRKGTGSHSNQHITKTIAGRYQRNTMCHW
jgi:hypothetical protein